MPGTTQACDVPLHGTWIVGHRFLLGHVSDALRRQLVPRFAAHDRIRMRHRHHFEQRSWPRARPADRQALRSRPASAHAVSVPYPPGCLRNAPRTIARRPGGTASPPLAHSHACETASLQRCTPSQRLAAREASAQRKRENAPIPAIASRSAGTAVSANDSRR